MGWDTNSVGTRAGWLEVRLDRGRLGGVVVVVVGDIDAGREGAGGAGSASWWEVEGGDRLSRN